MKIIVLGAGLVGGTIALDLAQDKSLDVTVADIDKSALLALEQREEVVISTHCRDLSDTSTLKQTIKDQDLVVGALPGFMGFKTLKHVIQAGKDVVDISFFPQDPFPLDDLAKKKDVTAVVDCGIAPGASNMVLGHMYAELDQVNSFRCYVGGLPVIRRLPFEYKAPFSPVDVIEEYTRPARLVKDGKLVTKPALSDVETMDFPEIGTLEAFNTDGLRTLIRSFPNIPNMAEKTLRYPGHVHKIKLLRDIGFFSEQDITVSGHKIKPRKVTERILLSQWKLDPDEIDLTVMKIQILGRKEGGTRLYTFDLLDYYDDTTQTLSMARTTGYTCSAVVRLLAHDDKFTQKGIRPPEYIGQDETCYQEVMQDLKIRNIDFKQTSKAI